MTKHPHPFLVNTTLLSLRISLHSKSLKIKVKPGGILIYDGYGIINPPTRKDIKVYRIDAMDAANEMNNAKAFNMIVLGGLLNSARL